MPFQRPPTATAAGTMLETWLNSLYSYAGAWGLNRTAAIEYTVLSYWASANGYPVLPILSGNRTQARQDVLRGLWDSGRRQGLSVRPARRSMHTGGGAWDLAGSKESLRIYGYLATLRPNVRWGGAFGTPDPVHFDLGR